MLKDIVSAHAPPSPTGSEHQCGGCGSGIRDRFYLVAADRAWHGSCLRCCQCAQQLDSELSCFSRDGNIYCKEDYYRLFAARRCDRCGNGLCASELVMRAREFVFHVGCFSCTLCGAQLSAGDTAAIRGGRVLCAEHCDVDMLSDSNSASMPPFYAASPTQKGRPRKRKLINPLHSQPPDQCNNIGGSGGGGGNGSGGGGGNVHQTDQSAASMLSMDHHHQTELPLSSLDLSYDGSQSPGSGIGTGGGGGGGGGGMGSDGSGCGGGGGGIGHGMSAHSRSKRMRTSFKHHQLRTMKSYFAINQNPDAKDLKQLAQKTGLSKRVLQVWFQNARAKWRRNVMRQDGNAMGQSGGNGPLAHLAGNLTPHTSHGGPPSVQSSASSSNMDGCGGGGSGLTPSHALEEMHHMTFAELY